ncbi:MAG: hypothetical protein CMK32_15745 [Porticoccaceae bacterium]|nr:hypothetical protein [Porticoccaceae bacterium]
MPSQVAWVDHDSTAKERTLRTVASGTADLVLETEGGVWIIDHKSDQVENPEVAFGVYRPQLKCYAKLLQSMGHAVLGLGINWILSGVNYLDRRSS